MIKIAVDAFGGDGAPAPMVGGAVEAVKKYAGKLSVVLTGDETALKAALAPLYDGDNISIVHAPDVIGNDEVPTKAVKEKKSSSMVAALRLVADGECDAVVSAGSTGALLTGAFMIIKRIKGVSRPVLCTVVPKVGREGKCVFLDCGANSECKPEMLAQFAVMGAAYSKSALGVAQPSIALLSNGAEKGKGNELVKAAYPMLEALDGFAGNCEARDVLTGGYDVVATDGWTGNIALKAYEGMANCIFTLLKENIKANGLSAKIGAVLLHKSLRNVKHSLDYSEMGGGIFLGVEKPVVKAHGASSASTVALAIGQAVDMVENKVIDGIKAALPSVGTEQ